MGKSLLDCIKSKFLLAERVILDYEGDKNYLSFSELFSICEWLKEKHPYKKFVYTISVRSTLYDIAENREKNKINFLNCLFSFYEFYHSLEIILVAGNNKYLGESVRNLAYSVRFELFISELINLDRGKLVFIGVDGIFKTGQRLMKKFSTLKAVFLLSPNIKSQMNLFSEFSNSRLVIYALQVTSIDHGLEDYNIRSYLIRRGVNEDELRENIKKYSILENHKKNEQIIDYESYFWFLFKY